MTTITAPERFVGAGLTSVGSLRPGGVEQIVSSTQASPTEVTCLAPHGLVTGERIFFTASTTANAALTATPYQVVTVGADPLKFTVPVDCSTAGATAGAYDYSIRSTPTTPAAAPRINAYREHGLRVGDVVTITASGSTPNLDGDQTVTEIIDSTSFRVLTSAAPTTVAGSVTAGHYVKKTYNSDVFDRGVASGGGSVTITSVIGTAPATSKVDIQGSADGTTWFNIPYALVATPRTFVLTQLTITTSVATTYLLQELVFWRYLRLAVSSNTNVTLSAVVVTL